MDALGKRDTVHDSGRRYPDSEYRLQDAVDFNQAQL